MKANELRIGNYFDQFGYIHQVGWETLKELTNTNDSQIWCKPIPLTEDWLLKLGFERHHADYSNAVIYIKDVPNNSVYRWGVYPFELGSGFQINNGKPLEHVHQLQNLYFALTGEELTIK